MNITTTRQFTLDEYHRLIEIGFFHEDERIKISLTSRSIYLKFFP